MPEFSCGQCGKPFEVPQTSLDKFPGWTPRVCLKCKGPKAGAKSSSGGSFRRSSGGSEDSSAAARAPHKGPRRPPGSGRSGTQEENLPVAEVLARFTEGPKTGVFTDGAAHPNPGAGGWGAVYVVDDQILGEKWGKEPATTNNRMELAALEAGIELVPRGSSAVIFTDSQLCVNTFTLWAKGWEKRGWKRKEGPIKNLEMVQHIYRLLQERPELELRWIAAHSGNRWNEYADALATAYRRAVK